MTAALLWLRAHKQFAMFAGAILAVFTSGYCAGRRSVSKPAVHEVVQEQAKVDATAVADTTVHKGAGRTVTYNFDPVVGPPAPSFDGKKTGVPAGAASNPAPYTAFCRPVVVPGLGAVEAPPGERLESVTIEDEGATDTETHAQVATHEESTRKLDLAVSPAAAIPRVSAFWLPSVSPGFNFGTLGVDVRLTDRVSVMAGAQPFAQGGPTWMLGARVGIF